MTAGEITGNTRVYVHIAHPSSHVRTPQTFNAAFRERGIDAVAVSIDVAPEDLHALMAGIRGWRNLGGIGVTIPHKQAIAHECDEVVGLARQIKAVNAIRREPDGRLIGTNTDGSGFIQGLRREGRDPTGLRALLVGTGGGGRSIAWALADAGVAELAIANRTRARAEELAAEIASVYPGVPVHAADPDPAGFGLVVNATPLGMHEGDPQPLPVERLEPGTIVAEIIMSPPRTPLLAAAESRGCVAHPGLPMLTSQVDMVLDFLRLA
jgi:shikimate dehydrogenase